MAWTIGDASRRSGVHAETIRYWERAGLLAAPDRTEAGRRVYSQAAIDRLTFIRRCRDLGLTQTRVRDLLALVDGRDWTCDRISAVIGDQLGEIRRRIRDLRNLERSLAALSQRCDGGETPDCAVIETLFPSARHDDPAGPA